MVVDMADHQATAQTVPRIVFGQQFDHEQRDAHSTEMVRGGHQSGHQGQSRRKAVLHSF